MGFEQQTSKNNQLSFKVGTYTDISGKAIFNTNDKRRYFLEKRWGLGGKILTAHNDEPE